MPTLRVEVDRVDVTLSQADVAAWANDPDGPVFGLLDDLATRVQFAARRRVGYHTGRLHNTIRKQRRNGANPQVAVVAGLARYTPYLWFHMRGTEPHEIKALPNRPNAHLRWIDAQGVHFRRRVWHPGTPANPFLERALAELSL